MSVKLISLSKFKERKTIGEGKSGTVYLVTDPDTKKKYAVKVYSRSCNKVSDRNLISIEFDKLCDICNHAILKTFFYSLKDFDKKPFPSVISEYIPRGSLADTLAGKIPASQQKEWTLLKRYIVALGIACGMKYLHDNDVIHGDLTPSKILLDDDFYPHIFGFQLNNDPESPSFLAGKPTEAKNPLYVAPEILLDCSKCSKESDVYSYSMVVYELITGKPPFKSYDKKQLLKAIQKQERPDIPKNYEITRDFFESCWCENPEQRITFDSVIQLLLDKQIKQLFKIFDDSEAMAYLKFFKKDFSLAPSETAFTGIFNATLAKALGDSTESESDDDVSIDSLKDKLKKEKEERKNLEYTIKTLKNKNKTTENENNRLKDEVFKLKDDKLKLQKLNVSLQTQLKEAKSKAKKEKEKAETEVEEKIEPVENLPKKKVKFLELEELEALHRVAKIGKGNSSKVYKVTKNETLALKVFDTSEIEAKKTDSDASSGDGIVFDPKETEKNRKNLMYRFKHFIGEYEILNNLNHPNIIETYGFFLGDNEHRPSILLQYCPYNLSQAIKRISEIEKVTIIYELSEAMIFVHMNNIIHRDLKPENILLDEYYHVKLSDFGISTLIEVETQTQQRTGGIGTIEFMAPELFDEKPDYDEKVDVYAFGVVMYYILTGGQYPNAIKAAFARKQIEIPSTVNDFSKKLIQQCIAVNASVRPSFTEISKRIKDNNFLLIDSVEGCKTDILNRLSEILE